jgi:hypothetical protein
MEQRIVEGVGREKKEKRFKLGVALEVGKSVRRKR